jgi:hypothetical protein
LLQEAFMLFPRSRALRALAVFFVLALALVGCGSDNVGNQGFTRETSADSSVSTTTNPTPVPTATIVVQQTLAAKTAAAGQPVPANIVSYRFTGTDANGNVVFGPTVVAKAATVTLTVPVTTTSLRIDYLDANGTALFTYAQAVSLSAGQTVTITDPAFQPVGSSATQLSFTVQPTSIKTGGTISPAIQVSLLDANGNLVSGATDSVTLAIGANPGGATLSGIATVSAVSGVATFTAIGLSKPGNGYTLTASAAGLTSATSSSFNVVRNLSLAAPVISNVTGSHFAGQQVTSGDLDGDGKDDIVTADNANNQIIVCISVGDGTVNQTTYAAAAGTNIVGVADLDGDGKKDVVAACSGGVLSFFKGNGNGTVNNKVDYNNGNANGSFAGITFGDFDGDQKLDVMVSDSNVDKLSLFHNDGNFQFTATNYDSNNIFGADPISGIAAGDVNGDGVPDIALAQGTKQRMTIWTNAGGNNVATLFPFANITQYNFGNQASTAGCAAVTVADFDNDGKNDVAMPCIDVLNGHLFSYAFFNNGDGTFGAAVPNEVGDDPLNIGSADFNLDGIVDIGLTTTFGLIPTATGDAEVLLSNGDRTFQPLFAVQVTGNQKQLRGGAIGDFNGDGLPDVVGESDGDTIAVFLNTSQ